MKSRKSILITLVILIAIIILVIIVFSGKVQLKSLEKTILNYSLEHDTKKESDLYFIKQNKIYLNDSYILKNNLIGIKTGYFHVDNKNRTKFNIFLNGFCYRKDYDEKNIKISFGNCDERVSVFDFTGSEQVFIAPYSGYYNIELWGASGGKASYYKKTSLLDDKYGKGAYVSGKIYLEENQVLYVQVGGKGGNGKIVRDDSRFTAFGFPSMGGSAGYNGGGSGYEDAEQEAGGGGGGATDIRLTSGKWNDFDSLKSRIMVAGGGGGMSRYYIYTGSASAGTGESGSGGTLKGIDGKVNLGTLEYPYGRGSTQTNGYKFGIGDNGGLCMTSINGMGGGAGGYMGSYSGRCAEEDWSVSGGAGGASSYVSGCKGCKAIKKNSTENNLKFENHSIHYSDMKFTNIKMKSGEQKMPNPHNGKTMIGNDGNGFARIMYLGY